MVKLLLLIFICVNLLQPVLAMESAPEADNSANKTLLWPDGTRYVGGVKDGKRSGKGTIFWQDGTRFVGTFVDDKRNGPGTMILPDGTVYNGYFENDTLVERTSEPTAPVAQISAEDMGDSRLGQSAPENEATEAEAPPIEVASAPAPVNQTSTQATAEPAATPANEATTAAIDAVTRLTPEVRQSVQSAVDGWANAWSEQNVEAYLAAYSAEFDVPGRQSRRQWEGLRRSRLTRPSRINVRLSYDTFELIRPDTVQVDFNQVYESNLYSDRTNKRLLLQREDQDWRIISEQSR